MIPFCSHILHCILYPKILAVSRHVHQFKDDVIELLKKCPFTVEVQDLFVSSCLTESDHFGWRRIEV